MSATTKSRKRKRARASVIVDAARADARHAQPWTTAADREAAPIPQPLVRAMYLAAWTAAERIVLIVRDGRLEPVFFHEPSDALVVALADGLDEVIGAVGVGVPVFRRSYDGARRAIASWQRDFDLGGS